MNISKRIVISLRRGASDSLTLQPGEHRTIEQPGRYFLLISNSLTGTTEAQIGIGDDSLQSWPVLFSTQVDKEDDYFDKVRFYNASATTAMTIEYCISNLRIDNKSAEVTGTITIPIDDTTNGTETPAPIVALPAAGFLIDNAAAVNVGGGVVGIPVTDQPFATGESITITGTVNYNGTYSVLGSSTANQVNITATYVAETFDGTDDNIKLTTPRSIPAVSTRKELHIANHDASYIVYWGDVNIDAAAFRGMPIQPESVYIITCTDKEYLVCEDGAGKDGCIVSWANKTKT